MVRVACWRQAVAAIWISSGLLGAACGGGGGVTGTDGGGPDAGGPDARPGDTGSDPGALDDADAGDVESDTLCEPGSRVCATARSYLVCGPDGNTRSQTQCDDGLGCLDGDCAPTICTPFEIQSCYNDNTLTTCNFSGTAWVQEDCPAYWTCQDAHCVEPPCIPGSTRCDGLDRILTCDPTTGAYVEQTQCASGTACYDNECEPLCEINRKVHSYVGCEYWTVDLDNYSDAENIPHTVVLSNPSSAVDATVKIVNPAGDALDVPDTRVPAGGQLVLRFPPDFGLVRAGITDYSWQITSSVPVTAHQFNPLDNFTDPFSNDGTLLLPVNALGKRYYALSWVHRDVDTEPLNGFLTIVAVENDGADLTIHSTANALVGDGAPPLTPGEDRQFHLDRGQVLNIETAGAGDDLTGSYIESADTQIVVFGGHECGNVPLGIDRCDHMETQLLPIELLSTTYIATKFQPRVTDPTVRVEPDYYRILAVAGATEIHTDPEIPGADGAILASGEWLELAYRSDFIITADRPIAVAHYMVGANYPGIPRNCYDDTGPPTGIGDPAMTQLIPVEQFRSDYIVLTPFAYVEDFLNLAVPTSALDSVLLDGQPVAADAFTPVADGTYSVARVPVEDGPHKVTASQPFGLDAYGYSCHVSYAYPGGLNLEILGDSQAPN